MARTRSQRRTSTAASPGAVEAAAARDWAIGQGWPVAVTGRVPDRVITLYREAQAGERGG